jgi:hypothetical protein
MTPSPTLRLDHNNQALIKKVCLLRYEKRHLGFAKTQIPNYTIKVRERGHDFLRWPPLPTNPLGCT